MFIEKGYDQTTVSDIVKNIGVAQGTFYYYFNSKEDVLNEVIERYFRNFESMVDKICGDDELNAQQKLQMIIDLSFDFPKGKQKMVQFLHYEKNILIHQRYSSQINALIIPKVGQVLEQGISEGLFRTGYPRETTELLLVMFGYLHDSMSLLENTEEINRKLLAAKEIVEKVLGVKTGTFKLSVKCRDLI
ncbi:TetR/AcrR family transcriptional regulator [Methanocella sp. CWC-04]|uniref:TetR/AcrR family transcriptional regulator n=2 Tax=Methanooceanicella nereidis TaxID=2052831 RepID=A0AAP2RFW6_9EURY|nr:TetR/AcrR family transcriptional regulator [Methanocella sp. CWC-04]